MKSKIQTARQKRGWTVSDLAQRVGVSPRTVEGWEGGKVPGGPAKRMLEQILKIKMP
jgi:ribosome-binding protein aMBF1 (putative translation factor)